MPLWAAAALLILLITGAAVSFRAYFKGGGKLFLACGITISVLCVAALLYIAAALLFVSSID
jgi:hypothetical protein